MSVSWVDGRGVGFGGGLQEVMLSVIPLHSEMLRLNLTTAGFAYISASCYERVSGEAEMFMNF
jgi:hypothetical protein